LFDFKIIDEAPLSPFKLIRDEIKKDINTLSSNIYKKN